MVRQFSSLKVGPSIGSSAVFLFFASVCVATEPGRVMPPGQRPPDHRLTDKPRNLDGYFPFIPPSELTAWEKRRVELKTQLQVALGLWPMPPRGPLQSVIHGAIDRDGYTVEKVYFASLPGHYVTGNLYRPKTQGDGRHAAVLCPHGHWANGRMFDAGDKAAQREMASGAETWTDNARYILQAKCAQLARMGCVVFQFDMLGYADSTAIPHREGFTDIEAVLRLQSQMGLQTWNCIRALDFVASLPDVDASRIGVTGGSGGGTQSFILTALDDRIAASFPAVMVSTAMQGGCICENAPYLRVGAGNVEIAAMCAPRPLGMTGANDWTRDIESKGLPELKALYRLYGADDRVMAWCFPQFGHNYNQVAREVMANWFNRSLTLNLPMPIRERAFVPIPPKDLSVFDASHPRPKDEAGAEGVKRTMSEQSERQMADLGPSDPAKLAEFRRVVGAALRVMLNDRLPAADQVAFQKAEPIDSRPEFTVQRMLMGRTNTKEAVPALWIGKPAANGDVVVWVHPAGKSSVFQSGDRLVPEAQSLVDAGLRILALDVIGTGESSWDFPKVDPRYAGYTFGYNSPLVAERVHDILTAIVAARQASNGPVSVVGWDAAGPWVVLANAVAGDAVGRCAADVNGFRFEAIRSMDDPMMLPGAVKYGGLGAVAALAAPRDLLLYNHRGTGTGRVVRMAYETAQATDRLRRERDRLPAMDVAEWLRKTR